MLSKLGWTTENYPNPEQAQFFLNQPNKQKYDNKQNKKASM